MPHPRHARKDIQQQEIRDLEVNPDEYYPKEYHPQLLTEWPLEGDLVAPAEQMPESVKRGMGEQANIVEQLRRANGLPP